MENVKRLCPVCNATNSLEKIRCHACGADMQSNLPVPLEGRLPVPWKEVGASLAVGVGALALRAGVVLARHLLERKAVKPTERHERTHLPSKARGWLPRRGKAEEAPQSHPQPQVRVWGRRMWGRWRSDGDNQWEIEEFYWQADRGEQYGH